MANRHFFGRAALVTSLGLGMLGCNDGPPTTVPHRGSAPGAMRNP